MWKTIYELKFIPEKSLNEEECADLNAVTSNAAFVFFPRLWKIGMFLILFRMWNIERSFELSRIIKNKTKNSILVLLLAWIQPLICLLHYSLKIQAY